MRHQQYATTIPFIIYASSNVGHHTMLHLVGHYYTTHHHLRTTNQRQLSMRHLQ
jgi:hypothetical protein